VGGADSGWYFIIVPDVQLLPLGGLVIGLQLPGLALHHDADLVVQPAPRNSMVPAGTESSRQTSTRRCKKTRLSPSNSGVQEQLPGLESMARVRLGTKSITLRGLAPLKRSQASSGSRYTAACSWADKLRRPSKSMCRSVSLR
jgi:hypothetical protein